jgi:replicative superfamily II helicase
MVDFRKRLGKGGGAKPIDPIELYEGLDRASDKGPLRPAQLAVLKEWHAKRRNQKDTILKLHTGAGKTLLGLLMLQSKLNEGKGPALYLCPNNFLINQTCDDAKRFGLKVVRHEESFRDAEGVRRGGDLPDEFLASKAILVTSVQKLFNGLTKFKLGARSIPVASIVLDDSHACIDSIRDACTLKLGHDHSAYSEIRDLFDADLRAQGAGTLAEMKESKKWEAILPVPYWAWIDRADDVANILARHSESMDVKFAWQLLKDSLRDCQCVISGTELEIHPHVPPLDQFGSYAKAECRIFMSATVTDDSFLVKGLGLDAAVIKSPLAYEAEKWTGEKMILIPTLIDARLERSVIVKMFGEPFAQRTVGVVVLCPGDEGTKDWKKYGATVCDTKDIYDHIARLRDEFGDKTKAVVLSNRYDGIDLPDGACRILIMDSKPFAESVLDRYMERCLGNSEAIATKTARRIEQGLGRAVRGEKDYCVVLLIGQDLVAQVKTPALRGYFSPQTRMQVEIGLEIAKFASEDAKPEEPSDKVFGKLLDQSLGRDDGWKSYYTERMNEISVPTAPPGARLEIYQQELLAERKSQSGDYAKAAEIMQGIADKLVSDAAEKGWYLQESARYLYRVSKVESGKLQQVAHNRNRYLLWPRGGVTVTKMVPLAQARIERIRSWLSGFETSQDMLVAVDDVLGSLVWGGDSDKFEGGLDRLGEILGFATQRPDKEWKEGPDNLWALRDNEYLLFEDKNQVALTRIEITKYETEQMNTSSAWFAKVYPDAKVTRVMVIPTKKVSGAAAFHPDFDAVIMRKKGLDGLIKNVRSFFTEFRDVDMKSLGEQRIQAALATHHLSIEMLTSAYFERPTTA